MRGIAALCLFMALIGGTLGCSGSDSAERSRGVYLLLDTSGSRAAKLQQAQDVIYFLLRTLQPGDTLTVSRVDTGRFSEKDIVAKTRFDQRPSVTNAQKRSFQKKVDAVLISPGDSTTTDISGGILQAIESLNASGAGRKYILIFSELKEESAKGFGRDVPLSLYGVYVVAFNVAQLREDNYDLKSYLDRAEEWRKKTEKGGGQWRLINDMGRLEAILSD